MPFLSKQPPRPAFSTPPGWFANSMVTARFFPFIVLAGFLAVCGAKQARALAAEAADMARVGTENPGQGDFFPNGFTIVAGPMRGVGSLGAEPPIQSAPSPPAYGGTPGDYTRGYEGINPTPGDFWRRESDFHDRNYTIRHGSPPAYAAPPRHPVGGKDPVSKPYDPTLPKPPLPGDSDPPARVRPVAPKAP